MKLFMLHCIDIGTLLSYDDIASSFLINFTSYMNKSYKNAVQNQFHVRNQKPYFRIANSSQITLRKVQANTKGKH